MAARSVQDRVEDMIAACKLIEKFVQGLTHEQFIADEKSQSAIERQLLIIGEAANGILAIDENFFEGMKGGVDFRPRDIVDMANLLRHAYHNTDPQIIFDTAIKEIPDLLRFLK